MSRKQRTSKADEIFSEISAAVGVYVSEFCASDGCDGTRLIRQYCGSCYAALKRNGTHPKFEPRFKIAKPHIWIIGATAFKGDECLIWPFSTTGGYGEMTFKKKHVRSHVISCEAANGPKPSPDHVAAHDCGVALCCNPNHLSWKTQKENIADKIVHGTAMFGEKHHQAKLTEKNVKEIRSLRGKVMRKDLAIRYGVKKSTIDNVLDGITWRNVA